MRTLLVAVSIAFVADLVPATAEADRCTRKLEQTFAGTHVRAVATFLPAPPGEPETELTSGAIINVLAEGKPGRGQIRGVARQTEMMGPPEPPGPECAGFDIKSPIPTSSLVETFLRGNDQLYMNQVDSGDDFVCIAADPMNPLTPRVSVHATGDIVGGSREVPERDRHVRAERAVDGRSVPTSSSARRREPSPGTSSSTSPDAREGRQAQITAAVARRRERAPRNPRRSRRARTRRDS